jgi:hypothetical protein
MLLLLLVLAFALLEFLFATAAAILIRLAARVSCVRDGDGGVDCRTKSTTNRARSVCDVRRACHAFN